MALLEGADEDWNEIQDMEAAAAARNMDSMDSMEEEPEEEPDPLIEYFQQPQMPAWMMQARAHIPIRILVKASS